MDLSPDLIQRLNHDRRCFVVVVSVLAAMLMAIIVWLLVLSGTSPAPIRGRPIYFALMLPFGYWGSRLIFYTPWTVRWLREAQVAAPILAGLGVGAAARQASPALTDAIVLFGVCLIATCLGVATMRGSLLDGSRDPAGE